MFYDYLKEICIKNNTTPTQLLKDINVSTGSLGNWKKGALPNSDIIIRIATHLNVSTDYLLLGKDSVSSIAVVDAKEIIKDSLSADERSLVNTYRDLNIDGKTKMLDISKELWADYRQPTTKLSNSSTNKLSS